MYRAIQVSYPTTKRKSTLIANVLKLYRKTAQLVANFQWFLFFKTGSFTRKANIKHLNCPLSERFKSTIQYHVALDFGMECFLVSDRGDLFGRKFYSKVREYAEKIVRIQREMQRRGKKPTESRRYLRLQHRLSEYVRNEVRRIINRVI